MRVALSLMRRNEKKIMACTELEDVMGLLLSRALWDTYGSNADDLVNDFVGLTGLVTREGLENLERTFKEASKEDSTAKMSALPNVQAAASRFLGRFWAGSASLAKLTSPTSSLGVAAPSRPSSFLRRTPSKQSMASTLNSIESTESHLSTTSTEATAMSRNPSADCTPPKSVTFGNGATSTGVTSQDRDLHSQIEDLLTALSDMQRDQAILVGELQKEREEREDDRAAVQRFIEQARKPAPLESISEDGTQETAADSGDLTEFEEVEASLGALEEHFSSTKPDKRSSLAQQTKHQMREDLRLWKDHYEVEATRSADLTRHLAEEKAENARLLEQFRDMRTRMQEAHQDKQRLEKTLQEMRSRRFSTDSEFESVPATPVDVPPGPGGLRELKLGRSGSVRSTTAPTQPFSKRSSSLGISTVLATENHRPASEDALLLELVNAKTAEAVARQELEEVKGKLDALRKMIGSGPAAAANGHRPTASEACLPKPQPATIVTKSQETPKVTPPAVTLGGGFFSGWGKRTASNPPITVVVPETS